MTALPDEPRAAIAAREYSRQLAATCNALEELANADYAGRDERRVALVAAAVAEDVRLAAGQLEGVAVATLERWQAIAHPHTQDEHCTPGDDGCCVVCGVAAGDPCPDCGARSFHLDHCPQIGEISVTARTLAPRGGRTSQGRTG